MMVPHDGLLLPSSARLPAVADRGDEVYRLYGPRCDEQRVGVAGRISHCPSSSVVVHVPHAGLLLPSAVRLPTVADLGDEVYLMADLGVDLVAGALDTALVTEGKAPTIRVTNVLSRIIMDPERFDSPDEEMDDVGMGVIYTRTHDGRQLYDPPLTKAETEQRKQHYHQPYHEAFSTLVDDVLTRHDQCLIIDLHSYATEALRFEQHQTDRRPPVCLGHEPYHAPDVRQLADVLAGAGFATENNQPYSGSYVPPRHWHTDPRVRSVMVEIRKDQYLSTSGSPLTEQVRALGQALADFV